MIALRWQTLGQQKEMDQTVQLLRHDAKRA